MSEETKTVEKESRWLVLRVIGGKERKIKEYIDREIKRSGWENLINQVLCPIEKVYKVQNGKKVMREKILFPGYMLIEATNGKLTSDMIENIRSINGVIHFLGKEKPESLRKSEVNKMFGNIDDMADDDIQMLEPYIVGETVKIIDGPFNDFNGTIQEIDEDKKKIKAIVKIFGRDTPVELNYMQVQKVT
jgi:transcription termination/antitermination protein NusG